MKLELVICIIVVAFSVLLFCMVRMAHIRGYCDGYRDGIYQKKRIYNEVYGKIKNCYYVDTESTYPNPSEGEGNSGTEPDSKA